MQFTTLLLSAAMATLTYAQSSAILEQQAKLPACGVTCLTSAAATAGCAVTDYACQCGRGREAITQAAIPCIVSGCQASDLASITQISTEICRLAAVENISSGAASATSSVAAATSSAASKVSSMVSSATKSVTPTTSGTATGTAAQVSSTGNAAVRNGVVGGFVGLGAVVAAFL